MIEYITGDLFQHLHLFKDEYIIIPHVCNDRSAWGSGFVIPIIKRWPQAKVNHYALRTPLGRVEFDNVEDQILLANMIAQRGLITDPNNPHPLKYEHLVSCMVNVRMVFEKCEYDRIVCPKFGSLRAGADWKMIELLINEIWENIPTTIFEYKE